MAENCRVVWMKKTECIPETQVQEDQLPEEEPDVLPRNPTVCS